MRCESGPADAAVPSDADGSVSTPLTPARALLDDGPDDTRGDSPTESLLRLPDLPRRPVGPKRNMCLKFAKVKHQLLLQCDDRK